MVYHLYTNHHLEEHFFRTFSKHGTVANPSFCTITGLGGFIPRHNQFDKDYRQCTELGLTGGKLENSSSLDGGTGTNDLLT